MEMLSLKSFISPSGNEMRFFLQIAQNESALNIPGAERAEFRGASRYGEGKRMENPKGKLRRLSLLIFSGKGHLFVLP